MPSSPDPERAQVEEAIEWFNSQDWHYMTEPRLGVLAKAADRWLAGSSPDLEAVAMILHFADEGRMPARYYRDLAKEAIDAAFPGLVEERPLSDTIQLLPQVTRVEVIDDEGRQFVRWEIPEAQISYQDGGRTLKLFLKGGSPQ